MNKNGIDSGYITYDTSNTYPTNAATYGLTEPGTWGVTFDYGKVIGESSCYIDWEHASNPVYFCSCRVTDFISNSDSAQHWEPTVWQKHVSSGAGGDMTNLCTKDCAKDCAEFISSRSYLRKGIFLGQLSW